MNVHVRVKARPILFNAPMVRAILEGRKTQTRRIIKDKDFHCLPVGVSPIGQPGDRLWVRETWAPYSPSPCYANSFIYRADIGEHVASYGNSEGAWVPHWKPSIHMPRRASRILLEIVSVRVERLQDISEADAASEGCNLDWYSYNAGSENLWPCERCQGWQVHTALGGNGGVTEVDCRVCDTSKGMFRELWNSINGHQSWEANPYVWVVEFKRMEA